MDDPGHTSQDTIENFLELTADYANRQSFQALHYLDQDKKKKKKKLIPFPL